MEEQKLCSDCKKWLEYKYGERVYNPPYQHCHHPEPEKPSCRWCTEWRELSLTWHNTPFWRKLNYLINVSDKQIEECPVCGGKIG